MSAVEPPLAGMVDVAFALEGQALPRDHRRALAAALALALPWLRDPQPRPGVHRLNVTAGGVGAQVLLSRRTRLVLRVPRGRADEVARLSGVRLDIEGHALRLGEARVRELLPWGTLYAHFVASDEADEASFLHAVEAELDALGVSCRAICGRAQQADAGRLHGYSVMLDGLSASDALRMQELGLGAHRELGCGVFVPHKSAAAVGTPH